MLLNYNNHDGFERWVYNVNKICGPFSAKPIGNSFLGTIEKVGGFLDMSRVNIKGANLYKTIDNIREGGLPSFFCVFQIEGSSFVEQMGNSSTLASGDIFIIDSATPFRFTYHDFSQQLSLVLPRDIIERIINLNKIDLGIKICAKTHIANFASKMVIEASRHETLSNEEGTAVLDSLVTLFKPFIIKDSHKLNPYDRIFIMASDYIKNNIGDANLTPQNIASSVGISLRGLYRVFSYKSINLSEHIKKQRLKMSAEYIKAYNGKVNITEVVYRFGFSNPSYFSTLFKNCYNMTPTEYKNLCLKSIDLLI